MAETPLVPKRGEKKDDFDHQILYQVIAARRCGTDNMMWQAPVLSLTAQAFLLTIALGPETAPVARYISAGLALLAALASLQLMARHRHFERSDSKWLEAYEKEHLTCLPLHGRNRGAPRPGRFLPKAWPSHCCWYTMLALFVAANVLVIVLTIWWRHWLDP